MTTTSEPHHEVIWPLSLEDTQEIVQFLMPQGREGLILGDRLNAAMGASARRMARMNLEREIQIMDDGPTSDLVAAIENALTTGTRMTKANRALFILKKRLTNAGIFSVCDCCGHAGNLPYHHEAHDGSASWDYCQACYDAGCDLLTCSRTSG